MIDGEKINLGGEEYVVPALNLKQLKRFSPRLKDLGGLDEAGMVSLQAEIVHAAITRNYPEIALDQVEEMLDLRNIAATFQAVMNQSGLEKAAGETKPVAGK